MSEREPKSESGARARSPDPHRRLVSEEEFKRYYADFRDDVERTIDAEGRWALVGIKRRGAILARRLWHDLRPSHADLEYGEVDISLYRDDYHLQVGNPKVLGTEIKFAVESTSILLVDDVLFTGRTVRAAMDLLLDFGRPRGIWLAVFVDRGNRELPIAAHLVGYTVATRREDHVMVLLKELGDPVDVVDLIPG